MHPGCEAEQNVPQEVWMLIFRVLQGVALQTSVGQSPNYDVREKSSHGRTGRDGFVDLRMNEKGHVTRRSSCLPSPLHYGIAHGVLEGSVQNVVAKAIG